MTYMARLREQERQKRIKQEAEEACVDKEFDFSTLIKNLETPQKRHQRLRESVFIVFRKDFEAGKIHSLYALWHTVATALSFTFFMALFSAESYFSTSTCLKLASVCFALSIVFNGFFCLFYQSHSVLFKMDIKELFKLHMLSFFELTRYLGLLLTLLGTFCVISYFSTVAVILSFAFSVALLAGFLVYLPKKLIKRDDAIFRMKMDALERKDFDLYERICRIYED
ncbi:hypothetical protein LWU64_20260 [Enterobacter hormaechei]|nr:hypothetical protein [Enterobacter hormaechei]MCE1469150.1 hypothetical protein [Enterobacter hormaechei]